MNSELSSAEMPPPTIWHHGERLEEWFASVSERRRARYRGEDVEDVPDADDEAFAGEDSYEEFDSDVAALRK